MQFTQGLHRAVQQKPDAVAIVCGERSRSFRQLHERVARLASALQSLGIKRGDVVAMHSLNSDRYIEYYLACAWLGALANPINFRWSVAEIVYSLNDSRCMTLISDANFAAQSAAIGAEVESLRHRLFFGDGPCPDGLQDLEALLARSEPIADAELGGDELFGVFYTGGTTGAPKGVLLSHLNICSSGLALMADGAFSGAAVGLHAAPMFHLADMMLIIGLLLRGGTHIVMPAYKPDAALAAIQQWQISDLLLIPAMLQALVDHPAARSTDTSSVQRVMYGGSPASEALIGRAAAALPSAEFMQVYGMTEMSAVMTVLPPSEHRKAGQPGARLRSGGRAACHVQMRIVDADDADLPVGEVGEIAFRGANLMHGYLNKADATASALRGGWMHTGDMGYLDSDGYLFIVDRLKDMIVSGGENVYSTEVENAVASHPAVAACAVFGIPSAEWGESVHAAIVLKPGAGELTQQALYEHCKTRIAGYKCPRSIELREALPLSGAGKVLKTELRKPHWEGRERAIN